MTQLLNEGLCMDAYKTHIYIATYNSIKIVVESTLKLAYSIRYPHNVGPANSIRVGFYSLIMQTEGRIVVLNKSSGNVTGLREAYEKAVVGLVWHSNWNLYLVCEDKVEYWTYTSNGWVSESVLQIQTFDRISAFYIEELQLLGFSSGFVAFFSRNNVSQRVQFSALKVSDIKYIKSL